MATPDHRPSSTAELTPDGIPVILSISEIADQTGISESVLRIWEARYGWPRPGRHANGYRWYPLALVGVLRAVHDELQRDRTIGDLMRDPRWSTIFETGRMPDAPPRVEPPRLEFSSIPLPASDAARDLRAKLEQALVRGDHGQVAWIEAQAGRLHPRERESAVTAVLRVWRASSPPPP